ncbi:hypothetical protein [Adhaeribacter radiodurans]|uniref:Uncharacterized protein n=1 Tax=Adhaeribacter radiodurans TaxID=2745197 RepID=A0A7L7LAM4_9BACT|nr:hypothetical protein [Adhaeribacter radiodurans]QMU29881.1 hypothetical protein HUW48_18455 [Adhaeribacter radiodurans]
MKTVADLHLRKTYRFARPEAYQMGRHERGRSRQFIACEQPATNNQQLLFHQLL